MRGVNGRMSWWVALVGVPAVAGCGGGGSSTAATGAPKAGSITVYSGQHEQTMGKLVAEFTRRTGIKVKLRSADEASLANQVLREGARSPADVFVAENPPAQTVLDAKRLLAPVDASTLAKVPSQDSAPTHDWVGISARSAVLAYNTDQVKESELPTALADLALPKWKGKVGFAPTETDFQPLITVFAKLHGSAGAKAWLEGLKANAKVYDDNEALIAAVNSGEIETGLVDHYYWYRLRDEVGKGKVHSALHYWGPGDAGALVDVSGASVLKSSSHQDLGQRFLAYLVSAPAQQIVATSESYEYPIGSGVQTTKVLKPFSALRPPNVTSTDLGDGRSALQMLQDVGLL